MIKTVFALSLAALLVGCAAVQQYGAVVIQKRREMNDMQARATMAATCDIALGSFFRELSPKERMYVALVCGGQDPAAADFPMTEEELKALGDKIEARRQFPPQE